MDKWQTLVCVILLAMVVALVIVVLVCTSKYARTYQVSDEAFTNPFIGYAPMAQSKEKLDHVTLAYCEVTWGLWEPEEGKFDTAALEKKLSLSNLRERGFHLVLRFICDLPGDEAHRDIPDWLYEKTGDGMDYDIEYGRGYSPNYNNPVFIEAHRKAVLALGEYLGQDTFVSYVELGSLGHWGEWHVDYASGLPQIPSEEIRELYVEPYQDAFPNALLLMRRPFTHAEVHGFGLYNDMTGEPKSTLEWLDWIENGGTYHQANEEDTVVPMPDAWETSPIGGEFTSSTSMEKMLKDNLDTTLELLEKSHMSFIGPKMADPTFKEGYDSVLLKVGYRLNIPRVEIRRFFGQCSVILYWENDGAAPMYQDLPVHLVLTDADGKEVERTQVTVDLRSVLPGETVKTETAFQTKNLDRKLKKEGYHLLLGIEDPLYGKVCVRLAQDVVYEDGWNYLF